MKFRFYVKYATTYGESLWLQLRVQGSKEPIAMQYFSNDFWKVDVEIDEAALHNHSFTYQYILQNTEGVFVPEFEQGRFFEIAEQMPATVKIYDVWNYAGEPANVFYSAPFQNILLHKQDEVAHNVNNNITHLFSIKAPLLQQYEAICLLGNTKELTNWNTAAPLLLSKQNDVWKIGITIQPSGFPVAYKYGIYNTRSKKFIRYEDGGNRICMEPAVAHELTVMQDGFINVPANSWKGAGVAIPVFSLKTKNSYGVGEFTDIKLLADWANKTGLQLIQLLPVNDTTATHTWRDSYPYAAISAFALHPLYISLEAVSPNHKSVIKKIKNNQQKLNELATVDYEQVMADKISVLKDIFSEEGNTCLYTKDYQTFFNDNRHWLKAYAAFCYLRDVNKTPDAAKWKAYNVYDEDQISALFTPGSACLNEVQFYCFVQYHLHLQLKDAVQYAHKKGIIIKGDIPIGVYRYGCDAWVAPQLYHMQVQAGAPPDDFAVNGQNWGFPTYNWQRMQADGFAWWRRRFEQMSRYFDAFRIDHILGFFRIWSIPLHAVQGIMGRFDPCLPVSVQEFGDGGIWFDYERFCIPYITDDVLWQIFGESAPDVKEKFLRKHGPQQYMLLPQFDTQRKIEAWFNEQNQAESRMKQGLYDLVSNVILFEEEGSKRTKFHFRFGIDKTTSYQNLQPHVRQKVWDIYVDYFYRRQDDFWKKASLQKLPQLKAATNMLVCGEDLGMVPHCVPEVMQQLGILSLEIQRMPKQNDREFFNPADAPYLSVVTPSTHDMSTVRGWWQEDWPATRRFFQQQLGQNGDAPYYCEPWVNRAIVLLHLYSPAMWAIFQLQDLLGMSEKLRRQNPEDERINVPANPQHYWRYRMHVTIEDLLQRDDFNKELKEYVTNSGRERG